MRHFLFSIVIAASTAALPPSVSARSAPFILAQATTADVTSPALDSLFDELKRERDPKKASRISERIWAEWRESGSATANLLMVWADQAMRDERYGTALDFLDQVVTLFPDFPEGWNRRATLHYVLNDHAKSMADINRVLQLEPRHFGALAGMASIMQAAGRDKLALQAWERTLEVYPANRDAQRQVGELADKLAGDAI